MKIALEIAGSGAVTAAGLTSRQTCAALRAGLTGFSTMLLAEPLGAEQTVARVPSHWSMRQTPGEWLLALASRALREALEGAGPPGGSGRALYLIPPEGKRIQSALEGQSSAAFLAKVAEAGGIAINRASRILDGGAAAALGSLAFAAQVLESREASEVIILGVDSFLNPEDLSRLAKANRLLGPENSQGFIPGEGAIAVRIVPRGQGGAKAPVLLAVATTREPDSVEGPRFSQGRALFQALASATADGALEPQIEWIVSNVNGERYAHWEALLARTRFFRTRRESLPVVYPAMTVGEMGAASGLIVLLTAHDALVRGHAPGHIVLCDAASEGGLRSAAILGRPA